MGIAQFMKAVIQRTTHSKVKVDGKIIGEIGLGFMVLLGIMEGDTKAEADALAAKITGLRVFEDEYGKMNLSLNDVSGEILVVSNFTLGADCKKGRRPSFSKSARPEAAQDLYEYTVGKCREFGVKKVETGLFGADMNLEIINDGPVTIILDTDELTVGH